ncbi:MAG TPA: glycerol-3-phosphate dehydrogenase/oxidase [Roseiflexaceae bacterium]|nr:glycerol-3-phosphate dehydrogenase/oxidase [Roseiflexaceae bacterium]
MRRSDILARIRANERWDVVVVGGGATGLGTALDAAARGYSTLLLESVDFAKGTSSRSTKLVHGGVRYLAQGNISLVYEALQERGRLRRNAPHLVSALPFVVPGYTWWSNPFYGAGLLLYSVMAGSLGIGFSRLVSAEEALRLAPTLEPKGLRGGVVYYDGQFDDTRLAVALLRTLHDQGGLALNYAPVTGLVKEGSRVRGVQARDTETGEELTILARAVVNATGVYADTLRQIDQPETPTMLSPSQGIHIVLDRSFLPGDHAIMIPKTDDGRVLFAVPWHNRVVVGTTDTPVTEAGLEPRALPEEVEFLLSHAARYLSKDPSADDVLSIFAGLRPLVKAGEGGSTAALSRDHTLVVSPSGLITITGGKWTTYRHMAEDTVNKAAEVGELPKVASPTKTLRLRGWTHQPQEEPFAVYGADAPALRLLLAERPGLDQPLHPRLPYLAGEVVWAARYELARTVEDVLARRTRALLLDARASAEAAPRVAELLAQELGLDAAWQQAQVEQYRALADGYTLSGGHGVAALPSTQEQAVGAP